MSNGVNIAVLISLCALIPVGFLVIDRIRNKHPSIVKSALELVEANRVESSTLRTQLLEANATITSLNAKLRSADEKVIILNRELREARDEVAMLHTQVNIMTRQLERKNRDGRSQGH